MLLIKVAVIGGVSMDGSASAAGSLYHLGLTCPLYLDDMDRVVGRALAAHDRSLLYYMFHLA